MGKNGTANKYEPVRASPGPAAGLEADTRRGWKGWERVVVSVILGWRLSGRNDWDYRAAVEQVAESGRFLQCWGVRNSRGLEPGTEAWLLLQGRSDAGSGLIGHGLVVSEGYRRMAGDALPEDLYVTVAFDALLPLGEQIRPDILKRAVPDVPWDVAGSSATQPVAPGAQRDLRQLWRMQGPRAAHHARLVPGTHPRHTVLSVDVNRYEQNADARRVCLAFHGTACAACGFSFEETFGDIGREYIDVHHVVPPEMLDDAYQLDPVADLIPLCPNCHAMAHYNVVSPRTVSELRSIMSASGHLQGELVTERALEAQEDAARILEAHD